MMAYRILEGTFGNTKLDGVIVGGTYHWPGPLHLGNGTFQPYLSGDTTPEQRDALLTILSGKAGNAWFEVLASVVSTVLEPQFVPIEFSFDLKSRKGKVKFGNDVETTTEPIRNLATGDEHHILMDIPNGMEYRLAEVATTGILKSSGQLKFDCPGAHSSLAVVEHTHTGLAV
jgi:hypothetical protein